ncbi:hypothetical protein ENBRE01_2846 [Enteropsectra breve]|nr:hypothetical protein ENBRE01_2846 [Enteropsectra breve]
MCRLCVSRISNQKKSGGIRLIVDYRAINSITIKEAFPFPNVRDVLQSIPKSKVFSQLDLKQGYHQIEVDEPSRKYTAFVIPCGHYGYTRVPFGLANAPRLFQRTMLNILGHLPSIKVFLDDFLIFSQNDTEHGEHLNSVLNLLIKNNLTISFEKSNFFQDSVSFLGHIISEHGIKPDISRIKDLDQFKRPETKKQLLHLLGVINWFRPFIPKLSELLIPRGFFRIRAQTKGGTLKEKML